MVSQQGGRARTGLLLSLFALAVAGIALLFAYLAYSTAPQQQPTQPTQEVSVNVTVTPLVSGSILASPGDEVSLYLVEWNSTGDPPTLFIIVRTDPAAELRAYEPSGAWFEVPPNTWVVYNPTTSAGNLTIALVVTEELGGRDVTFDVEVRYG